MKKVILVIAVICSFMVTTGCGQHKKIVRMGDKVDKSLDKDDYGFYTQDQARFNADDHGRVTSMDFRFKKNGAAAAEVNALNDYKKVTNKDLKHISGNTYYSKKMNHYYIINQEQQSDGRVVRASIFFKNFDPINPEKFYNK